MGEVNCEGRTTREINAEIKQQVRAGREPYSGAQPRRPAQPGRCHPEPVTVQLDGSVGYYCAGLIDGANFEVAGSAGWGLAESMMNGQRGGARERGKRSGRRHSRWYSRDLR